MNVIRFAPLVKCPGINGFDCQALIDSTARPVCSSCHTYAHFKGEDAASGEIAKARRGTRSSTAGLSGLLQNPVVESKPQSTTGDTNE